MKLSPLQVGYGSPSQRKRQYDSWRADKASERVFQFKKDNMMRNTEDQALVEQEKEHKFTRKIKTRFAMFNFTSYRNCTKYTVEFRSRYFADDKPAKLLIVRVSLLNMNECPNQNFLVFKSMNLAIWSQVTELTFTYCFILHCEVLCVVMGLHPPKTHCVTVPG